jgi:dTDP-4-dehydrorhamnose 3,5-epimerase
MFFERTELPGVWIIDPLFHKDDRGRFFRTWCSQEFLENDIHFEPVQGNMGFSFIKGTLRGVHFQLEPASEAKLIRCTRGSMFDVAVDLRPQSPTYLRWVGTVLSAQNGRMLYIPEQCAHGYQTLEDETEMYYMSSQFYVAELARGVRYDDPAIDIQWPVEPTSISTQDRNWPLISCREIR